MLTPRQNLIAALEGELPERIPFTIYHGDFVTDDPAWEALFAQGLCPVMYPSTVRETTPNVERVETDETWQGCPAKRLTLRTPVGEIWQLSVKGWVQEYFLKTPADYRVMEYIVRDTYLEPSPEGFWKAEELAGERGISLIWGRRSPMQTILVDYAGLEMFSYHLAEGFTELFALAEASQRVGRTLHDDGLGDLPGRPARADDAPQGGLRRPRPLHHRERHGGR